MAGLTKIILLIWKKLTYAGGLKDEILAPDHPAVFRVQAPQIAFRAQCEDFSLVDGWGAPGPTAIGDVVRTVVFVFPQQSARVGREAQDSLRALQLIPSAGAVSDDGIRAAEDDGDLTPFHTLVDLLAEPHHYRPEMSPHATPPRPEETVRQTFCGT